MGLVLKSIIVNGLVRALDRAPQSLIDRFAGQFCPIFMLHRSSIGPGESTIIHTATFIESVLDYVNRKRCNVLSLKQLTHFLREGEPIPPRSVSFTFDDGFVDQAEIGGELFAKNGTQATFFIISDFIDEKLWPWDDQVAHIFQRTTMESLSFEYPDGTELQIDLGEVKSRDATRIVRERLKKIDQTALYSWIEEFYRVAKVPRPDRVPAEYRPMSWEQAQKLIDMGHSVGPHTGTHRILSRLDTQASNCEIVESAQRVLQKLDGADKIFAYPTGRPEDYSTREVEFLQAAGFESAVNTVPMPVTGSSGLFELPRYAMPYNLNEFARYLGCLELLREKLSR